MLLAASQEHTTTIETQQRSLDEIEGQRNAILLKLPNLAHETVPVGSSEAENVEVRRHGTPPALAFEARAHWDLGPALGIIDFERGVKLAGARFTVLMGAGARLARGLIDFMLDIHSSEHGYEEVYVPYLVGPEALRGTGQLPKFADDLFKMEGERELYLIPTAEVPVTNFFRDEIVDAADLPLKRVCHTPCFRREAGSWGKDVRGLNRLHQFDKVELVKWTSPETSFDAVSYTHLTLPTNREV